MSEWGDTAHVMQVGAYGTVLIRWEDPSRKPRTQWVNLSALSPATDKQIPLQTPEEQITDIVELLKPASSNGWRLSDA